ncbi:MAG TPA: dTMP kinase, partial [Synergistaceae bacterium]|nr:dTMP kinase [Synergistaceae bacterium]
MFITLEGIDGSGKSTQLKNITDFLEERIPSQYLVTREPGGWDGGKLLKKVLLETQDLHVVTECLLFLADRNEHVQRVIAPALKQGLCVVCERYMDSTQAYQVGKNCVSEDFMRCFSAFFSFPLPDLTLFYSISPEDALKRISQRSSLDTIEARGIHFLEKVANQYEVLCRDNPLRMIQIDASASSEMVWENTKKILRIRWKQRDPEVG